MKLSRVRHTNVCTRPRLSFVRLEFGAKKKKPTDYQGGRTKSDIVQYVKNSEEAKKLGVSSASIASLDFAAVHTFLTQNEKVPSAIFFGSVVKKSKKKAAGKVGGVRCQEQRATNADKEVIAAVVANLLSVCVCVLL